MKTCLLRSHKKNSAAYGTNTPAPTDAPTSDAPSPNSNFVPVKDPELLAKHNEDMSATQPQKEQRGMILPFMTDAQGHTTLAVPEIIHGPAMAFSRLYDQAMNGCLGSASEGTMSP
jgi:hypothetical protein